jgi:hypothetical protein
MSCLIGPLLVIGGVSLIFVLIAFAPAVGKRVANTIHKWKNKQKKKSALETMGDDEDDCILFNIKRQVFDDKWEEIVETSFLKNEEYGAYANWSTDQIEGMVFGPVNVDHTVEQLNKQFRDYCVRYSKVGIV